jgi:hypothetical protein
MKSHKQPDDPPWQFPILSFIDPDTYAQTDSITSRMTSLIQSSLLPASRPVCGLFTIFGGYYSAWGSSMSREE